MKIALIGGGYVSDFLLKTLSVQYDVHQITRASHGDFLDIQDWSETLKNIDVIVHLVAKIHGVAEGDQNSSVIDDIYYKTNVDLVKNVLYGVKKARAKQFIFVSTAAVYNGLSERAYTENEKLSPTTLYGQTKLEAEEIVKDVQGIVTTIFRPPLIYGPNCRANFMALAKAVRFCVPLPLKSIRNRRDFLYIGNLCTAIEQAIKHEWDGVFNITDNEAVATPELIQKMANIMGKKAFLLPFPVSILKKMGHFLGKKRIVTGLTDNFTLDTQKICQKGIQLPYSVDDGLKSTFQPRGQ